MRREPTRAESLLWDRLRAKGTGGLKFRRQHVIGPYIVDFYCAQMKVAVEVDGPVHLLSREHGAARQGYLEGSGVRVLRFTNEEVEADIEGVLRRIAQAVE